MRKSLHQRIALTPLFFFLGIFMIGPLIIISLTSFLGQNPYGGVLFELSFKGYQQIIYSTDLFGKYSFDSSYLVIIFRSLIMAILTTLGCFLLGFPVAYFISLQREKTRNLLIMMVTIPFWTNLLIRTYAWIIILGKNGVIEKPFRWLNIVQGEDSLNLMYTDYAVGIGLLYSYLPLMVLPIYASMEKLDRRLLEAGSDLYSNTWTLIRKIIIPLTQPGIIGGALLVFIPSLGAFIAPTLLGGGKNLMLGSLIQLQFSSSRNWPFGAALSIILLITILLTLIIQARYLRKKESRI